jgi:poly-gamma-glutamate capsule biosynthesis protein CapA/YwtB (metallophosphatase superfamily)/LAS superfamily LD-carboxypeptidase LdcB
MKKLFYILGALSIATIGFCTAWYVHTKLISTLSQTQSVTPTQSEVATKIPYTTLYFTGDIMLDRSVRSSVNKNFAGDYNALFANLAELKNADILFANLEGDVSDTGNNVGSIYSFRMDPLVLPALKNAGVDIVSFANNHVGDWNTAAFTDTLARLDEVQIAHTGAGLTKSAAEEPTVIEKNGVRFGFIGFSDVGPNWLEAKENSPGILIASDPRLPEIIRNAKSQCDVLIVSFHWGVEYKKVHTSRQEKLAHTAVDSGADIIIGHHPHVIEDTEVYKGHPIAYSLGNFIFDQSFSADTMHGLLFEVTYEGKTLKGTSKKIIQLNKYFQPEGIYELNDPKVIYEKAIATNTCPKPTKEYVDETYRNVGPDVPLLDASYIPKNLVRLDASISKSSICATTDTAQAFTDMVHDAKLESRVIIASSGFRDYDTQKLLFDASVKESGKNPSESVSKPGYSEHQLGVALDVTSLSINNSSASGKFGDTKEYLWLKNNAYKYGFVQSYPEGKQSITGYITEPWHYRYVGIENAKAITESGLTINQFFSK